MLIKHFDTFFSNPTNMNEYREAIKIIKETAINPNQSDGCEEGDCNLQNRFPGICFHHLYYYF